MTIPNYENYYLSKKDGKTITTIPPEIYFDDGKKLTFSGRKEKGWSVGGWYKDENGQEFMVKFGEAFSYIEKMLGDLAVVCAGEEYAVENAIGHAKVKGEDKLFFAIGKIPNYQDFIDIEDIKLKKSHASNLHSFYVFNALISNDDLNEENIGLMNGESPTVIDYGIVPRFLYPEQIEYAHLPVTLASFIGHRNLNGMQAVRRRYFGHDEFLLPKFGKLQEFKPEDISYGSILRGVQKIVENKDPIIATIEESLQKLREDRSIPEEERQQELRRYSSFAKIISDRIAWMEENFREDLADLGRYEEKFDKMKWRLMPQFIQLMQAEEEIFKKCAQVELDKNFAIVASEFLEKPTGEKRNRAEILAMDLKSVEVGDIKDFVGKEFMLHDALIVGDFELAKWLITNNLVDHSSNRTTKNHNYQYFRLTPLHTAIAIYHDKLHYGLKSELKPLEEMIDILQEKFFAEKYTYDPGKFLPIELTYVAYDNFKKFKPIQPEPPTKDEAVAIIQKQFRSKMSAQKLQSDSENLRVK